MEFEGMNKTDYLERLKEPSTWAALAALAGVGGVNFAPAEIQGATLIGSLIAGLLGVFLPERKKTGEGAKKRAAK